MKSKRIVLVLIASTLAFPAFPAFAAEGPYLFDVLKKRPAYRQSFQALLASGGSVPAWIKTFAKSYNGVATPGTTATVDGASYEAFFVCKPHDCGGNGLEVFFTRGGAKAYAAFQSAGGAPRLVGGPSPALGRALIEAVNQ